MSGKKNLLTTNHNVIIVALLPDRPRLGVCLCDLAPFPPETWEGHISILLVICQSSTTTLLIGRIVDNSKSNTREPLSQASLHM